MRSSNNEEILAAITEIKQQLVEVNKRLDNLEHSTGATKRLLTEEIAEAQMRYKDILNTIENT